MQKKETVVDRVKDLAYTVAKEQGVSVWDIRFVKEGSRHYLRIFIDKPGGVGIQDCENFSRAIDEPIDKLDPVSGEYSLEICSPGLERELLTKEHFEKYLGSEVIVRTIRPYEDDKRELEGTLLSFDDGVIEIGTEDNKFKIAKQETAFVKVDDFDL